MCWLTIFLVIIIILIIIVIIKVSRHNNETKLLPQKHVNGLYRTMSIFDKILSENNIDYFISCGTLLGSIRNEGLISWDNDIDIGMMKEDVPKLLALEPEFKKHGITLPYTNNIQRVDSGNGFLDIFPYIKLDGIYVHEHPKNRWLFSKEKFTESELFPIQKKYKFGPLLLKGPNDGIACVEKMYGKSWKTPIDYGKNTSNWLSLILKYNTKLKQSQVSYPTDDYLQ